MLRQILFRNFKLFYRLDRWVKRRFTPIGMMLLGTLVAAAIFAVDTRRTLAYQIVILLLIYLVLAMISALSFRTRIEATRHLPQFATAGEALTYTVTLKNQAGKLQRGLYLRENLAVRMPSFEEFLKAREPGAKRRNWFDGYVGYPRWSWLIRHSRGARVAEAALPDLRPQREVLVDIQMKPLRRGYVRFSGLSLARPDPLGLFRAMAAVPLKDAVLVLPQRYPVPQLNLGGGRHYQRGGVALAGSVGDSQEFVSLRDYRPGDPFRHIHWKSWARIGEPIVKEFQDEFFVRRALVLDTFISSRGSQQFEEAVSVAASFVYTATSRETLLDLAFVGTESYYFTSGRGVSQAERLLEVLACVDSCQNKPFSMLQRLVLEHARQLSGCICVLLDWDGPRREFVKKLVVMGIPVNVFVVIDAEREVEVELGPMIEQPDRFHVLKTGAVREGLAALL